MVFFAALTPSHCWPLRPQERLALRSLLFIRELGKCLRRESGDGHAAALLHKCLSVAVQSGNCFYLRGGGA